MKNDESRLNLAIEEIRSAQLNREEMGSSAKRVAERLGIDEMNADALEGAGIENCEDVRLLLGSYRAGTLSAARTLLVKAHLHECGTCQRQLRGGSQAVDWTTPDWSARKPVASSMWRPRVFRWALAPALAVLACSLFVYRSFWQVPAGVRAEVISVDGSASRISSAGDRPLAAGDTLAEGDSLRTSGGAHAVIRLSDGSTIEINERSTLGVGARGHNMTVSLDNGAVIVEAAKRSSGHLYVKTPDCRVAVTGTLFSVNSGIKGSRVSVLRGSVDVSHAGVDTKVDAGDQLATSDNLSPAPLKDQISWSHDKDKFVLLLAQFSTLQHRIGEIPFPAPRYNSDLLERVPQDTLLYLTIPNLGDFLSQANTIFHEQLKQSPELQAWWGHDHDAAQLDSLVDKLHTVSSYLGDEVVVVGMKRDENGKDPSIAVMADLRKDGLADVLRQQFFASDAGHGLVLLNEQTLAGAAAPKTPHGAFALLRTHEVVFSTDLATLRKVNTQLNAGASGFARGNFGQQITAAYGRGAGVVLAADLHSMFVTFHPLKNGKGEQVAEQSGIDGVQYLIAEHRESNGTPENHLNLQFAGTRQRVASWLAAPAPIGALEFVSSHASVVVAGLTKDPKSIADDILSMASANGGKKIDFRSAEQMLHVNLRDDIAGNLGGEFLVTLDGPVLPTPSWKAVIEVHNPQRLEQTMEQLAQAIRNPQAQPGKGFQGIQIDASQVGSQTFYAVHEIGSATVEANYTFSDGYMIVAPTRALLLEALQTKANGDSLARSSAFKALLPKDANENYSAIAYQNLSPVLEPLLSQMSGESADALRKISADARPTAVCAWGRDNRIEAASDSRLFGFDFLTLGSLLGSRNKTASTSVQN